MKHSAFGTCFLARARRTERTAAVYKQNASVSDDHAYSTVFLLFILPNVNHGPLCIFKSIIIVTLRMTEAGNTYQLEPEKDEM
jgi:hypothetical protein